MDNDNKTSWLAGLLTGWGVPANWARVIAGAIIGALAAAGILTQQGCTASQAAQALMWHEVYHDVTGEPCILIKEGK